jgi:hypothetical protein
MVVIKELEMVFFCTRNWDTLDPRMEVMVQLIDTLEVHNVKGFPPLETYTWASSGDIGPLFQDPDLNREFIQSHGATASVFTLDSIVGMLQYSCLDKDGKNDIFLPTKAHQGRFNL